jgi:hypothetical protein
VHTQSRIHARIGFSSSTALTLASLIGLALAGACGGDEVVGGGETGTESGGSEAGTEGAQLCEPLEQQACVCDDGGEGVQLCDEAGDAWGECSECVIPPVCGDALCEPDKLEDCSNCPEDCGICLDCAEAPSCEAAAIPGAIETHLDVLDLLPEGEGMPIPPGPLADQLAAKVAAGQLGVRVVAAALDPVAVADEHPFVPALRQVFARYPDQAAAVRRQLAAAGLGVAADYRQQFPEPRTTNELSGATQVSPVPQQDPGDCDDPKLRVRVAKIIVHNESDLVFKDTIYCAIVSEAMPGAEIRVTPKTFALDNGDEYSYALAEGVVWGQLGEPVAPVGSLSMTYNCIEADGTGAFEEFLDAIADAALGADAIPGPYGWVLPVVGLAADIISAALALENDDHLFNASQIIPADLHLQMTQGVWWSVQRQGTFMLKNWHWELRMEAWGCTEDGIG